MLKVGKPVPNFTGKTNQGDWQLSDYLGKKVVIYFYPRDNTPGCTTEGKDFNTHLSAFQQNNAVVVGISNDNLAKHQKFSDKFAFAFPLIADEDKSISELFGVYQRKKFMGKEFMGIVRSTFLLDEQGNLVQEWRKVKVKNHVEAVLAAL
ncbi:MAG: peroxiredoxin [Gammaproteobacteria bacterium]|nr:MAG: peroxiredoxin [Gammaproteobacteria bacterium]